MTKSVEVHYNSSLKRNRSSNLELFRILLMLSIISHHYVVNSGLIDIIRNNHFSSNSIFFYLFGMWGKTGINCFVLITGFFMCRSKITIKKYLKLYLEVKFYTYTIYFILLYFGISTFSIDYLFKNLLPFNPFLKTSFTNGFMAFFLCIPLLNFIINKVSQKHHLFLILVLLLIHIIPKHHIPLHYAIWFCVLYLTSSYIRLYGIIKNENSRFWGVCSLSSILLSYTTVIINLKINWPPYFGVSDCNAPMAFITSICLFMFFRNINIKQSNLINNIGATTFGVFLIHTRGADLRHWLWNDFIDVQGHWNISYYWLYAIGVVVFIFITCSFIDHMRIVYLEQPTFKLLDKFLCNIKYYN